MPGIWYTCRVMTDTDMHPLSDPCTANFTPLIAQLRTNLRTRCAILPGTAGTPQPLVIGVSGGADSVALLCLLHAMAEPGYALHAVHFDHNLRTDSGADAEFVAQLAARRQIPFHQGAALPGELARMPGNLEANARDARYAFLCQVALEITPSECVPIILTAHHAGDQAETVLLHLARGSGPAGLGGMEWRTARRVESAPHAPRTVQQVRPLLDVEPEALAEFLRANHAAWRDDPTNVDTRLARNRVRHDLLPLLQQVNPRAVAALGRAAAIARDDAARLARLDAELLDTLLTDADLPRRIVLDADRLMQEGPSAQRGVVRQALSRLQGDLHDVGFEQIEMLLSALAGEARARGPHPLVNEWAWSTVGDLNGRLLLSLHQRDAAPFAPQGPQLGPDEPGRLVSDDAPLRAGGWTLNARSYPRAHLPPGWQENDRPWRAFFDADAAGAPQLVAAGGRHDGKIALLGMGGRHKRMGDLMTDCKIPLSQRAGWPVIVDAQSNRVLWVCGLRMTRYARITDQTRRVLEINWNRTEG